MPESLYRGRLRACPSCKSPMQQVAMERAKGQGAVDLCDQCGGVFLEFFDGEPVDLSRGVVEHVKRFAVASGPGDQLDGVCPDCQKSMVVQRYLEQGPRIARCDGCMAIFATSEQVRALASFRFTQDGSSWFERLVAQLGRMSPF